MIDLQQSVKPLTRFRLVAALMLVPMGIGAAVSIADPVAAATTSLSALSVFHHVPPYPNHVLGIDIQSPPSTSTGGSYVIKTSDSVAVVSAWYKQHLPDLTSDKTTPDGHHLFFTKNGSTVDVGKAIPFDGNYTIIGVVASK
jgi:hypothetical protein